jgi:hypothetical protein
MQLTTIHDRLTAMPLEQIEARLHSNGIATDDFAMLDDAEFINEITILCHSNTDLYHAIIA